MKTKRKIHIAAGAAAAAALLTVLILALYPYYVRYTEKSYIYDTVSPYRMGETEWHTPEDIPFSETSGEAIFLDGIEQFAAGEYRAAVKLLEQSLDAESDDPALPVFAYYYINECIYMTDGAGDHDVVAKALEAAGEYNPAANDEDMLWDMLYTVSINGDIESDRKSIALMQDYLDKNEDVDIEVWARFTNSIATIEYIHEEYAKSIRLFYDVELALENAVLTSDMADELLFAKEYIANIHYIFEDYEKTVALYKELIDARSESDPGQVYSYYINMSTAYLEMSDNENAKKSIDGLKERLPLIDETVDAEVEANMNNVLADICMDEGNYDEAEEYISASEKFFSENSESVFYGGIYQTSVSRCRYMIHEGAYYEAQTILEELIGSGTAGYYGIESDVCELLEIIYRRTEQTEQLLGIYEKTLEINERFMQTTRREYLEFSEYYREVSHLEAHNTRLSRINVLSILAAIIIFIMLITVLVVIRQLHTKNVTDQLTGVFNRKRLNMLMRKCRHSGTPENFGVIMMDIDYFKRYNDSYGHVAGDGVLKEVAKLLTESLRKKDIIIRYGGEEFMVVLNDVQAATAKAVCQRIRDRLEQRALPHAASDAAPYVTLSMGLCYQENACTAPLDKLIEYADECLYQSKEDGRNRFTAKEI